MEQDQIKSIVEGVLLVAGKPMSIDQIERIFEEEPVKPGRQQIREAINELMADADGRALELREVASGFRYQVRSDLGPWVSRLWEEKPPRYSRALLETLALIAYRQPVTRAEIEEIRGVSVSSHIVKTLLEREWVRVVGHRDVPGRPSLYGTTRQFLDYFNLKSLDELPTLSELRDLDSLHPELDLDNDETSAEAEPGSELSEEAVIAPDVSVSSEETTEQEASTPGDELDDDEEGERTVH
jgi:segregation and condensation protein B